MKIKDSFILGVLASVVIFFVLYCVVNMFTDFPFFSQNRDSLWVYMISLIPNVLLARFMLVRWDLESFGKGLLFTTLIGIILVMYIVLK